MGYGRDEDIEVVTGRELNKLDSKVANYFEYDWTEWNELCHFEKANKRKMYKRFNK